MPRQGGKREAEDRGIHREHLARALARLDHHAVAVARELPEQAAEVARLAGLDFLDRKGDSGRCAAQQSGERPRAAGEKGAVQPPRRRISSRGGPPSGSAIWSAAAPLVR